MQSTMNMQDCMTMSDSHDGKVKHPLCKMSAQCEFGSLYYPTDIPRIAQPSRVVAISYFVYAHVFAGRAPDGLWRPPRAAYSLADRFTAIAVRSSSAEDVQPLLGLARD
jgi:hypothetical protein